MSERPAPRAEHTHYAWSPIVDRPRLRWPQEASLAVGILVNLEYCEDSPPSDAVQASDMAGGSGSRPYPDVLRLSSREYGHRVGIFRVLDALEKHSIRPMIAIDAMTAEQYPFLVDYCARRGCEFVAHGIAVTRLISGKMTEEQERTYILDSLNRIEAATGKRATGWYGPEGSESERTPRLLAEQGVRYVCDWSNDDQPYRFTVPGGPLFALPIALDIADAHALVKRKVVLPTFARMVRDTFNVLLADGELTGRLLLWNINPWLLGQPFRIKVLEDALAHMKSRPKVWFGSGSEIVDWVSGRPT